MLIFCFFLFLLNTVIWKRKISSCVELVPSLALNVCALLSKMPYCCSYANVALQKNFYFCSFELATVALCDMMQLQQSGSLQGSSNRGLWTLWTLVFLYSLCFYSHQPLSPNCLSTVHRYFLFNSGENVWWMYKSVKQYERGAFVLFVIYQTPCFASLQMISRSKC